MDGTLTHQEIRALSWWKHRYALESQGFTRQEAQQLVFMRWLVANGRLLASREAGVIRAPA